ncbi:SCO family protein [Aestuariirhabdus sp. LZHN29]|uniref:SCO family protein n=1 Tax=Aestuariirhabdus sp. LZHN29 TaxID=3417462 RepID=UPI003CE923AD
MTSEVQTPPPRKGRFWVVPAMFLLFGLPYLVSYWWFFVGEVPEFGTSNHGVLMNPAPHIPPLELSGLSSPPIETERLQGKWILLAFSSASCGDDCLRTLFHLRQIRKAMGVERDRVERLLVVLPSPHGELVLEPELWQGMLITDDAGGQLAPVQRALTRQLPALENAIFVVDPRGDVILGYGAETNPKDIVKDLQKLLKVSGIG